MYAKLRETPFSPDIRAREAAAIREAVQAFAADMEARLIEKLDQGWRGWDDPANADEIHRAMLAHGVGVPLAMGQEVHIANFAMFLWFHRTRRQPPAAPARVTNDEPQPTPQAGAAALVGPADD